MSEHGINVSVLRKALEHITAHPEEMASEMTNGEIEVPASLSDDQ